MVRQARTLRGSSRGEDMKVNHQAVDAYARTSQVSATTGVDRSSEQHPATSDTAPASTEAASVTISPEARALATGAGAAASGAKVQHLRDQVNSGNFQVDAKLVAKRMLNVTG
jgi:flagellar biosynthesis anti-sigma factor FlgM